MRTALACALAAVHSALACALVLGASAPLHAQERGTHSERGGVVALVADGYSLDPLDRARVFGVEPDAPPPRGTRLVFQLDALESADPLAWDALELQRVVIDLQQKFPGDTPDAKARIDAAAAVELVGGTWSAWWRTLTPLNRSSHLATLLREAHRRGTPIVASGAAAGHLASWALDARAAVRPVSRNAHPDDPDLVLAGLGLIDGAFDTQAASGGSLQRLARAALRTEVGTAVLLAGRGAWIVDARRGEAFLAGERSAAAIVLDLGGPTNARRMRETIREARISVLRPGARWSLEHHTIVGARELALPSRATATAPDARAVPDALGVDVILDAIDSFARSLERPLPTTLRSPGRELVLTPDEHTRVAGDPGASIALVRCDITWEFPEPVR